MKSNNNSLPFFTELDCLLDTRIGTLARMDQDLARRVLKDGYLSRERDWFPGADMQQYQQLYQNRDKTTLAYSRPTACFDFLRSMIQIHQVQELEYNAPIRFSNTVVVNIHPYRLTDDELREMGEVITFLLGGELRVELVSLSDEQLTPEYFKGKFALVVMYDLNRWLNTHYAFDPANMDMKTILGKLLPELTFFAPAIAFTAPPTEQEQAKLAELGKELAPPLQVYEQLCSLLVGANFIDVRYFSIVPLKVTAASPSSASDPIESEAEAGDYQDPWESDSST